MKHVASRAVPIPVYAEMSSVNPVIILPGRMTEAAEDLGTAYVGSLALGAGQFCTNPGIVMAVAGADFDRFVAATISALADVPAQTMLTGGIREAYQSGVERLARAAETQFAGAGLTGTDRQVCARVYTVDADAFMVNARLGEENFGPSSLIIKCRDVNQIQRVLSGMEGQLTATLHMNAADHEAAARLLPILERMAGRIIANSWPTGVEVTHAMVHGGPFPATSDGRSTSVGTKAIERYLRPISYQDMPDCLLPDLLRAETVMIPRLINGVQA